MGRNSDGVAYLRGMRREGVTGIKICPACEDGRTRWFGQKRRVSKKIKKNLEKGKKRLEIMGDNRGPIYKRFLLPTFFNPLRSLKLTSK